MQLKRKIVTIVTWLIIFIGTLIIEEKYLNNNKNNQSHIQIEEGYEIKDLANLIGKNKGYVEDILGKGYEKEILTKEARVSVYFDKNTDVVSLINVYFKEDNKFIYKILSEKLWNELGKSSIKYISSDKKIIETWNKGDLEINFNKVNDYISVKIN